MRNLSIQLVSAALLAPQRHCHLGSLGAAFLLATLEDLPSTEPAGDCEQEQKELDNKISKLFPHLFTFRQG